MRILITTQVFPPEVHPTGVMVEELAHSMVRRGGDASVAAGYPHHPQGSVIGGYKKRFILREMRGDVEVRRGWHWTSVSQRTVTRAWVMVTQAFGTAIAAAGAEKPDVILNFGPPLVGPFLAALLAKWRGARFVPVIYDIYPDVAIETGKVRNPLVIMLARAVERFVYRRANRIVVLSEGFRRQLVARGVPPSKIDIVPVWLDEDEIVPSDRTNAWRREMGIDPALRVVLYAGTIGLVSGASVLLAVAWSLQHRQDTLLLFVGEGRVKDELEREARLQGLKNVKFLGFQPRERLNDVQATADISVVTLAPGRGRTSVPSKVVGYLAAGRPVVASVDAESDTAAAIRDGSCGVVTPPGDGAALASAITDLLDDAPRRERLGRAARAYFEATYSKDAALEKMSRVLDEATAEASAPCRTNTQA